MPGPFTDFFAGQVEKYQPAAEAAAHEAQLLGAKVSAANAARAILSKPTISQPEAERLLELYEQAQ